MDLLKAPTITRHQTHTCLEADRSTLSATELVEIEKISAQLSHVLPVGVPAVGSQWIRLIEDSGQTNVTASIELLKKGMRVIDFQDDYIVFKSLRNRDGEMTRSAPAFRGTLSACQFFTEETHWDRVAPTAKCSPSEMAEAEAHMLEAHKKDCDVPGSVQNRAREFLKQSPIRPEEFTQEQAEDIEAMQWLVLDMIATHGYGSIIGYQPPNPAPSKTARPTLTVAEWQYPTMALVAGRLTDYIRDMVEQGMDFNDPKNKLFLARPSAITHPTSNLKAFESFVHPLVIGWQIPTPLVKHVARQIQAEETNQMQRERA